MEIIDLKRCDIVACTLNSGNIKFKPAVIIQSHLFNSTHNTVTICPITTFMINAPLFRVTIKHNKLNGLLSTSQIMIDKMTTINMEKISKKIGQLNNEEINELDKALRLWLNLV